MGPTGPKHIYGPNRPQINEWAQQAQMGPNIFANIINISKHSPFLKNMFENVKQSREIVENVRETNYKNFFHSVVVEFSR